MASSQREEISGLWVMMVVMMRVVRVEGGGQASGSGSRMVVVMVKSRQVAVMVRGSGHLCCLSCRGVMMVVMMTGQSHGSRGRHHQR